LQQAPEHDADHGEANEGGDGLGVALHGRVPDGDCGFMCDASPR
jgi:hypothetical protein